MCHKTISFVLIIVLTVVWMIPPQTSYSQDINKYTIAVLDLNAQGIAQTEADYLSEYMRGQVTRLVNSAEYKQRANLDYASVCRSAYRDSGNLTDPYDGLGFRIVRRPGGM